MTTDAPVITISKEAMEEGEGFDAFAFLLEGLEGAAVDVETTTGKYYSGLTIVSIEDNTLICLKMNPSFISPKLPGTVHFEFDFDQISRVICL